MLSNGIHIGTRRGVSVSLSSGWTPAALGAQLATWFDASTADSCRTATDGTGAVGNGDAVAYIADLSGNARHATQVTAGYRPAWTANVINGRGGLRCSVQDSVITAAHTADRGDVFLVCQATSLPQTEYFAPLISRASGNVDGFRGAMIPNQFASVITGITGAQLYVNGATSAMHTFVANVPVLLSATFVPAAAKNFTWYAGGDVTEYPNRYFIGDICEWVTCNGALSASNRQAMLTYLAAKYGITLA